MIHHLLCSCCQYYLISITVLMLLEQILFWLVNLRDCNATAAMNMKASDVVIFKTFCSMSVEQWYSFSLLMARHLNMEKLIYRVRLGLLSTPPKKTWFIFLSGGLSSLCREGVDLMIANIVL